MGDRVCVRGCVIPKRHQPTCPESSPAARLLHAIFAKVTDEKCTGCLPREAYDGALICEQCIRRTRRALEDAADLCGHLRTLIDPRKAQVFDREMISGGKAPDAPAPMNVGMVDAADQIIITLTWEAAYYGDTEDYRKVSGGFPSWITPEDTFDITDLPAQYLIEHLPEIVNDSRVKAFTEKIIGWPTDDEWTTEWSIVKALKRFPMNERGRWSKMPCPLPDGCGKRSVWVTPPRKFGQPKRYVCKGCNWQPPILEQLLWSEYFEGAGS